MTDWTWFIYGAWTVAVVVGGILSFYSLVAWRRTHSRPMLFLAAGVLLLSVAAATAWVVGYDLSDNLQLTSMLSSTLTAAGLLVLLYSVRSRAT